MIFNQSKKQDSELIGKGISKYLIRDMLQNNRLNDRVKIIDCEIGYELEIINYSKQIEKHLQVMFEIYTNIRIKERKVNNYIP
ncbi:MAG: hypothetical protein H8D97_01650 [Proteobacteria bacterium]|nr:hypothetical protein [Pseudomonadota bacterium]